MPRFGLTPQEVELKKVISARLNALLAKTPYKKADVVRQTGISESTVYDYFNGKTLPSPESIDKLARFFHVDKEQLDPRFATLPENVIPVDQSHLIKIPLIGHIACGEPIIADQNIEGYITEYFPDSVDPDSVFALKCEGDSMEPYILDGDIAYIRQQPEVEDGDYLRLSKPDQWLQAVYKHDPDLRQIRIHGFRHTFASLQITADPSIKPTDVQAILGHESIDITMEIYMHATQEGRKNVERVLNQLDF